MLLNPVYNIDTSAPPAGATEFTVTVAAGKVASDLTGFPLMIDLADMPADFWTGVDASGGNVRAYASDGLTLRPHDVTFVDTARQIGRMFVRTDLATASATTIKVKLLAPGTAKLDVADPNGRNAVWVDYEVVWVFPDTTNRTGNAYTQGGAMVSPSKWIRDAYYDMPGNPHQGVAADAAGNLVTIDTNYLRRHTTSDFVTVLASNIDPVGAIRTMTGDTLVNHLSDGTIIAGELWVAANEYPNTGGVYNEYLCVFDIATLTLNRAYDVSSVGRHVSSICYNPGDGLIYATDYVNGASLMTFNTSGVYQGAVTLSTYLGALQGIEVVDGKLYLSREALGNPIYEVEFDGTVNGIIFNNPQAGVNEGISYVSATGTLYHMDGDGDLTVLKALDQFADWGRFHYNHLRNRYPKSTVWTVASSVYWQVLGGDLQQAFMSMGDADTDSSANVTTMIYDEGPDVLGIWNASDGWLWSTYNPAFKDVFRFAGMSNGTIERRLFIDGAVAATDATVTAKPSGASADMNFLINAALSNNVDTGEAYYQFVWARNEYMSADWMAADAANMGSPGTFYSVAAVP